MTHYADTYVYVRSVLLTVRILLLHTTCYCIHTHTEHRAEGHQEHQYQCGHSSHARSSA
jgi:hypothetical protein